MICHKDVEGYDKIPSKSHLAKLIVCAIIKSLETGTEVNKCGKGCKHISKMQNSDDCKK